MSNISVWVPLVVAGLGIFGTLAAALCTQVLQQRQEEKRKEESRRALAAERWLRDRHHLYAEFIQTMDPWLRWAATLRYDGGKVPRELIDPQIPDRAWAWAGAASVALAESDRTEFNRDEFMRGVRDSYAECINNMRNDLDIPSDP